MKIVLSRRHLAPNRLKIEEIDIGGLYYRLRFISKAGFDIIARVPDSIIRTGGSRKFVICEESIDKLGIDNRLVRTEI